MSNGIREDRETKEENKNDEKEKKKSFTHTFSHVLKVMPKNTTISTYNLSSFLSLTQTEGKNINKTSLYL